MKYQFFALIFILNVNGCASQSHYSNILHDKGFDKAIVGMSPKEISVALNSKITDILSGNSLDQYLCHYIYPNKNGENLYIMIEEGKATRFEIHSNELGTAVGVKVGDKEEVVIKNLNGKIQITNHPYIDELGKYILLKINDDYGYLIETQDRVVTEIRSGKLSSIQYIEGCL